MKLGPTLQPIGKPTKRTLRYIKKVRTQMRRRKRHLVFRKRTKLRIVYV